MESFFAISLTLFFVIDALGNIPSYLNLLKPYDKKKQRLIALRELFIALGIMIIFNYLGRILLTLLDIHEATVQLSGGIVLFLIAIRLIFSSEDEKAKWKEQEPFIVPIATPIIAGPSVLSVIMIFAQEESSAKLTVLGAIFLSWFLSSILFLFARPIYNLVKDKGLNACQRLMGLIVALIAVQLFLQGAAGAFR
jgi:multiple antibiotic resistance protein